MKKQQHLDQEGHVIKSPSPRISPGGTRQGSNKLSMFDDYAIFPYSVTKEPNLIRHG